MYQFQLTCTCGKYMAEFETRGIAETAAAMHMMLGKDHVVTCTTPAHWPNNTPNSVRVVVWVGRRD